MYICHGLLPFVERIKNNYSTIINFMSIGVVQATNFLIPLILYPYLYRIVGIEKFGAITYALNIMIYCTAVIDYGYNNIGSQRVALMRDSSKDLLQVVVNIYLTKLIIYCLCLFFLLIYVSYDTKLREHFSLYVLASLYLLGNAVLPIWLFQGLESIKSFTFINILSKVGSIIVIVLFTRHEQDYVYVLAILGTANIVSSLIALIRQFKESRMIFYVYSLGSFIFEIKTGWYFFVSSLSSVILNNSTIFMIGIYLTDVQVGQYSIAEKIAFAIWQIVSVFSQATYPILCRLSVKSIKHVTNFIRTVYYPFSIFIFFGCLGVCIFAKYIVLIATGTTNETVVSVLQVLCFTPFIVCLNVPAYQLSLIYGKQKESSMILNVVVIISLISYTSFVELYGVVGAAYIVITSQFVVTLFLNLVGAKIVTSSQ
jgi:polysaccharide transporter, PST family